MNFNMYKSPPVEVITTFSVKDFAAVKALLDTIKDAPTNLAKLVRRKDITQNVNNELVTDFDTIFIANIQEGWEIGFRRHLPLVESLPETIDIVTTGNPSEEILAHVTTIMRNNYPELKTTI